MTAISNFSAPTVLALDFDGVICDGLKEYFTTTWLAYSQIWQPDHPAPPEGLAEKFYRLRPLVETGWEMPVLLRLLQKGVPEEVIWTNWGELTQQILLEDGLKPSPLAATVDGVRDQWIRSNVDSWLAEHRFYPGLIERLQELLNTSIQIFIISTKEGRFIDQLLRQQGVQLPATQILGKEVKRPKHQVLRELMQEFDGHATSLKDNYPTFWFVEDRLKTLQVIKQQPDLATVQLFLADWGYNTPADRDAADRDDRIHLLSLEHFTQDFLP